MKNKFLLKYAVPRLSLSTYTGVMIITSANLHSIKLEFRFCSGPEPAQGVLEICDVENL